MDGENSTAVVDIWALVSIYEFYVPLRTMRALGGVCRRYHEWAADKLGRLHALRLRIAPRFARRLCQRATAVYSSPRSYRMSQVVPIRQPYAGDEPRSLRVSLLPTDRAYDTNMIYMTLLASQPVPFVMVLQVGDEPHNYRQIIPDDYIDTGEVTTVAAVKILPSNHGIMPGRYAFRFTSHTIPVVPPTITADIRVSIAREWGAGGTPLPHDTVFANDTFTHLIMYIRMADQTD
jgi:hypothetical protein